MLPFLTKQLYPEPFQSKFYDVKEFWGNINSNLQQVSKLQKAMAKLNDMSDIHITEQLKMSFVYHSNALEGSNLSLEDTIAFLQEDIIEERNSAEDYLDALGQAAAMGFIESSLRCGESIDRTLVCEINDLLTKHNESIPSRAEKAVASGIYKIEPNAVQLSDGEVLECIAPELVPAEMEELFQYCEVSSAHPVVKAAIAHYNFVRIHPFQHGNGRGARILMSLILQHYSLPPAVIQVQDKEKYLDCLHRADQGNILPFIGFVADSLIQTMQMVLETDRAAQQTSEQQRSAKRNIWAVLF